MACIQEFELRALDLPFKNPFKHAAAERATSSSVFLKCVLDSGAVGFGESLPREYVTGESRDGTYELLASAILPKLIGREFESLDAVTEFLRQCDGKAPGDWVEPSRPQGAAWCAVDLALLDAFGHAFDVPAFAVTDPFPEQLRYSTVVSSDSRFKFFKSLLKMRLFGFRQAKLKVDRSNSHYAGRLARRVLGRRCDIRADANMAWDVDEALVAMKALSRHGVRSFEQPLDPADIDGLSRLVRESGLGVMADESLGDRESLETLIAAQACTAVSVRISKCGGLIAAEARCREALEAGLTVQVGCQVGESSLLSAAQIGLIRKIQRVTYAEGCFGRFLLREDPVSPVLQFGYGGRPPPAPDGTGLGVQVDEAVLERSTTRKVVIEPHSDS